MNKTVFVLFVLMMFLLSPMYEMVAADVVEETRYLHIEADQDANVTYSSVLNIMNNTTNQRFTNFNQLVEPFITATGMDGGYTGSMLPPARFQLNSTVLSTPTPTQHNNLVLATTVEFTKKNLLSGSSESWWRSPFWYNHSTNSNFAMEVQIFHVDLPRKVNVTFLTGDNTQPVPSPESHPSLVFERTFVSCGGIRDDQQYYTEDYIQIPINDTWNSSKPNLLTQSEIDWIEETDGYNASGDFEYYQTYNYSFVWVNVTAPIYPNESYMVIWSIYDTSVPAGDEGACWVTATDIGRNEYGRSLMSWNSQTVYEIPIDLDCSVIFRTGLGDGVTGINLSYNDPDVVDYTSNFNNVNFESNIWGIEANFSSFIGWSTTTTSASDAWTYWDSTAEKVVMEVNKTGELANLVPSGDWTSLVYNPLVFPTEGETLKIAVSLKGPSYTNVNLGIVKNNAQIGFRFYTTSAATGNHLLLTITRRTTVETDDSVVTDNYIAWYDNTASWTRMKLPDTMPQDIYISIQNDEVQDESYIYIYDQQLPNRRIFGMPITNKHTGNSVFQLLQIQGAADDDAGLSGSTNYWDWGFPLPVGQELLSIEKITIVDRTSILSWTQVNPSSDISISKHNFKGGFETQVPEYNPIVAGPKNVKCLGFTSSDSTGGSYNGVYQTQTFAVASSRRSFASCYYQMRFNDSAEPYGGNTYVQLGIHGWTGAAWVSKYSYGYNLDSAWHQISTGHLIGTFSQVQVSIYVWYPTTTSSDIDIKLTLVDNVKVFSIQTGPWNTIEFWQQIDQSTLNSTNYLTLMVPFRYTYEPEFPPIVSIQFWNAAGSTTGTIQRTMPTDFYGDFLIYSMNRTNVPTDATHIRMSLVNFGNSTFIFLHDRNSDFYLNNQTEYKFNWVEKFDTSHVQIAETFFSPYYSLKATAGQWTNADSLFTTTPFYFVRVHFVRFIGNDPEVISVQMFDVNLENFEIFRFQMGQFGQVYDNEEWLLYLEIKNRPTLWDRIVDFFADLFRWLANTPIGQLLGAIGKFIYDALIFLVPLIQSLVHLILEAFIFILSVIIYFVATWFMWNFVKFWILVGQNRIEEGIEVLTGVTSKVTSTVGKVTGVVTGGRIGG